jgi:hypothetical protein
VSEPSFEHLIFEIWICFGFRYSILGFAGDKSAVCSWLFPLEDNLRR